MQLSSRPHILIAEADPFMRRTLEGVLSPFYELTFAADGEEALQLARTHPPHLIILELLLPRKDGFQVCRALKSDPLTQGIPILCFTYLFADERALRLGADAFLLKPLHEERLLAVIQELLQRSGGKTAPQGE